MRNFDSKTISQQLESIAEEICDNYCKYPEKWNAEDGELSNSEICRNCPLTMRI